MILRRFDKKKDYKMYSDLYTNWNLPVTPEKWIPEDTFVLELDNVIICGASLYQLSDTSMFWIEGIISNKKVDKQLRQEALPILINKLSEEARNKGAELVMTSTPRENLKEIFLKNGFNETPEKYYHLGRIK